LGNLKDGRYILYMVTIYKGEPKMADFLGTTWWSVLMFVAGALVGTPLWAWVSKKLPWNK
jgi:hypothetical protein